MVQVTASVVVAAPVAAVWAAYADFGEVQAWNPVVARSYLTSEERAGVGMSRHCDLLPRGTLEETVTGWEPESQLVVRVDPGGPIAAQTVTIDLAAVDLTGGEDAGTTLVRMTAEITLQPEAADRAEQMAGIFGTVLRSALAGLRHYVETGESVDETTELAEEGIG